MKKRLTSLLLSVVVTLSAMTIVPFGASAAKNTKLDEMTAVLSYLDIVSETQGAEVDLEKIVDRATFSQMMAAAIKVPYNSGTIYFADVPKDHWAASDINSLTDMGIISLAENRMFEPDRPIKYAEACKMLVCALGYQDFVNSKGGGMERWTAQATDLDIVAGGNANEITMATAIELIYEAMEAPMLTYESFPHTLVKDEDTTLFASVHDVYKGRGTVQSAYGTYMSGTPLYTENKAMVNGDEYNVDENLNMKEHFAHSIDFYYVHDDKMDENKIFFAKNRTNEEYLEIQGAFITSFDYSSYTLTYYETEDARRSKTERIEKSAQIVLNGAPYSGSLKDAVDKFINEERRGTITLFSLNGNGYDFVKIQSYEAFIVGAYDDEKMLLTGGFDKKEIDLSDVEILTVKDELGMDSDIGTIKNTVLNIAQSEEKANGNSEIVEIIGSPIAMTVKVDSYDGSDREITCGETTYKVDKRIWDLYAGKFTSLGSIQIKTDMFGYVIDIAGNADNDWRVGYVFRAKCFEENSDGHQIVFRIYTTDGKIEDLYFAEKPRIDGKSYNLSKNIYAVLNAIPELSYNVEDTGRISVSIIDQVIQYKLDADGKLKHIDTYFVSDSEDPDFSLTRRWDRNGSMMLTMRYGLDTYYNSATKCFTVPIIKGDGEIERNGVLVTPTAKDFSLTMEHKGDKTYKLSVYDTNVTDVYSEILVAYSGSEKDIYNPIIFDHINQVWDEEEEQAANLIIGHVDGREVEYYATDDVVDKFRAKDIVFGDMFFIKADAEGKYIFDVEKCVDAETMAFVGGSGDPYWYYSTYVPGAGVDWTYRDPGAHPQLEKFWVYRKLKDGFMVTYNHDDIYDRKYDAMVRNNIVKVIVVDLENEEIEVSTVNSLRDYYSTGTADHAVAVTGWNGPSQVILYK